MAPSSTQKLHSSWHAPLACIPPAGLVDHLFEGGTSGRGGGSIDPQLGAHGLEVEIFALGHPLRELTESSFA